MSAGRQAIGCARRFRQASGSSTQMALVEATLLSHIVSLDGYWTDLQSSERPQRRLGSLLWRYKLDFRFSLPIQGTRFGRCQVPDVPDEIRYMATI